MKRFLFFILLVLLTSTGAFAQFTNAQKQYLNANNILLNSGAEAGLSGWVATTVTPTLESTIVFDGAKSFKISPSSQAFTFVQSSTLNQSQWGDGIQGLAMVRVKTTIGTAKVCSVQAGTVSTTNCLTHSGSGKWELLKIPFILGATSNGISISSTSTTGNVYVDSAFVGPVDVKQDADQSTIAGESFFAGTTSCVWSLTSSTLGAFATTAACPGPTVVTSNMGTWLTTDTDLPIQTVNNLPPGIYKARFTGVVNNSTPSLPAFAINDGTTTCEPQINGASSTVNQTFTVECTFIYTTSGNRPFQLYTGSASGANQVSNNLVSPRGSTKFVLEYFGSEKIYSSICGLNCVDTFSAKVDSSGNVTAENVDWINGNCTSVADSVCTFNSNIFTVEPNCVATGADYPTSFSRNVVMMSSSASSMTVRRMVNGGGGATDFGFHLTCQKRGVDFNATRTITGSFKDSITSPSAGNSYIYSGWVSASGTISSQIGGLFSGSCVFGTPVASRFNCPIAAGKIGASGLVHCTAMTNSPGNFRYMQWDSSSTSTNMLFAEVNSGASTYVSDTAWQYICHANSL